MMEIGLLGPIAWSVYHLQGAALVCFWVFLYFGSTRVCTTKTGKFRVHQNVDCIIYTVIICQSWRKSATNYRTWCPVDSGILSNLPYKLKNLSDSIFENVLIFARLFDTFLRHLGFLIYTMNWHRQIRLMSYETGFVTHAITPPPLFSGIDPMQR